MDWTFVHCVDSEIGNVFYDVASRSLDFEQVVQLSQISLRLFCFVRHLVEFVFCSLFDLHHVFLQCPVFLDTLIHSFSEDLRFSVQFSLEPTFQVCQPRLHEVNFVFHRLHEHHHAFIVCLTRNEHIIVLLLNILLDAIISLVEVLSTPGKT